MDDDLWRDPRAELAARFAESIRRHAEPEFLTGGMLDTLTLSRQGSLQVVWAPFDHVNDGARLVVVGITPGRQQAERALAAYRTALRSGADPGEAQRVAKATGAFSGPIRSNLVAMLDHVGAHHALGVATTMDLFDPDEGLLHPTSALRYPVLREGANYSGNPNLVRTPLLRGMVDRLLAREAEVLGDALWVPLGAPATAALDRLIWSRVLSERRVLHGLPHPSGANAERVAYFLGRKRRDLLSAKTHPDPIDAARREISRQLAGWR